MNTNNRSGWAHDNDVDLDDDDDVEGFVTAADGSPTCERTRSPKLSVSFMNIIVIMITIFGHSIVL